MPQQLRLCLAGFGAVGQRFCRLLQEKNAELTRQYNIEIKVTAICTRRQGARLNSAGIELNSLFQADGSPAPFASCDDYRDCTTMEMIGQASADVMVELTTLSIGDGEPASSHIIAAFEQGMHVISANKGPLACQYRRLRDAAAKAGRMFLYETIVMDGTPLFNLFDHTLHGNQLLGARGILNGTSNFVLRQLEQGISYDEAIREAQRIQLAEADPSLDVDGWDGAAKICAIANILMDANLTPADVERTSIRQVSAADLAQARGKGQTIKYICEARRDESGKVRLRVQPQYLEADDAFCCVNGSSAALTLYTDLAGEITIIQSDPGILQTAYGVYSDLLSIVKGSAIPHKKFELGG